MSSVAVAPRRRRRWSRLRWLLRRAWTMEIHGYQEHLPLRVPAPPRPTGSVGFTYSAPILSILIVLTVVSAVELVVVDVIVHRWAPGIRVPLLILGGWGLIWMIGLLLGVLDLAARSRSGRCAGALRGRHRHPGVRGCTSTRWAVVGVPARAANPL